MSRQLRIGVIGAGRIAEHHLDVLTSLPEVSVVALCNRGTERLTQVANRYEIPLRYTDYRELLDKAGVDAVFVLVSIPSIVEVAAACLDRGLPTFIEKPPGLYSTETRYLADLAEARGVINMVGLNRRFYSNIQAALGLAKEEHGPMTSVVVEAPERFVQIRAKGKFDEATLRRWVVANGLHCFDLFLFAGGPVEKVYSYSRRWKEQLHPESLHALVEFTDGAIGHYISNWTSPGEWSMTLYGQGCRVDVSPLEGGTVTFDSGDTVALPISDWDRRFKPGLHAQDTHFIRAVLSGQQPGFPAATLAEMPNTISLLEALLDSADRA